MIDAAAAAARRASLPLTFAAGGALVAGTGNIGAAVSTRLAVAGLPVSCGSCERRVEEPLPEVRPLTG